MTTREQKYITEYRPEPKPDSERSPNIWPYVGIVVNISAMVLAVWVTGALLLAVGKRIKKRLKNRKKRKNQEKLLKLEYDDKENH